MTKLDVLLGYGIVFALVVALAVGSAILGMALGLFLNAFARSEFQAVQFMSAIVLPQLLVCVSRVRATVTHFRRRCRDASADAQGERGRAARARGRADAWFRA
jgi:hypothetical protein